MSVKIMSKPVIIAAATTVALAGVGSYTWSEYSRPPVLEIYVFALKSGQAVFVRTPDDKRILIDGGGSAEVIRVITKILPFYSRRVDTVIATSPTAKHTLGLIEVVNRYNVNKVYVPGITLETLEISSTTDRVYETFLNAVQRKNVPLHPVRAHNKIRLGNTTSAEVLFPVTGDLFQYSKASSPGMVLRITQGDRSVLLLGDVSKKIQKYVAEDDLQGSDVLVVGHDASTNNLTREILEAVKPDYLVYSQALTRQRTTLPVSGNEEDTIEEDHKFNIREGITKVTPTDAGVTVEIIR